MSVCYDGALGGGMAGWIGWRWDGMGDGDEALDGDLHWLAWRQRRVGVMFGWDGGRVVESGVWVWVWVSVWV
jgi:hypothetical protein